MTINIQVGSPVQYNCDITLSPNQNTTHAAIVTATNNDGSQVNLLVFPDAGQGTSEVTPFFVANVPAVAAGIGALNFSFTPLVTNP